AGEDVLRACVDGGVLLRGHVARDPAVGRLPERVLRVLLHDLVLGRRLVGRQLAVLLALLRDGVFAGRDLVTAATLTGLRLHGALLILTLRGLADAEDGTEHGGNVCHLLSRPHVVVGLLSMRLADVGVLPVDGRANARLDRLPAGASQRVASMARVFNRVRAVRAGKVLAGYFLPGRGVQFSHCTLP